MIIHALTSLISIIFKLFPVQSEKLVVGSTIYEVEVLLSQCNNSLSYFYGEDLIACFLPVNKRNDCGLTITKDVHESARNCVQML